MNTLVRPSWHLDLLASSLVLTGFGLAAVGCTIKGTGVAGSEGGGGMTSSSTTTSNGSTATTSSAGSMSGMTSSGSMTGGGMTASSGMTGVGGMTASSGMTGAGGMTASSGMTGTGGMAASSSSGTGTGGGTGVTYDCSPPVGTIPPLKLTSVATGLSRPMLIKGAPGDTERLYIVEQTGRIRILKNGTVLSTPFLDLTSIAHPPGTSGDERGFLGLAFHPGYAQNGRFFVFYTEAAGDPGNQVVVEYRRSTADPEVADPTAVDTLMTLNDVQSNHNGGSIEFSPIDGFLYIALGDGGGSNDTHGTFGNALNLTSVWGKIFRVDVSTTPYSIPAGNMTMIPPGNPTTGMIRPEIWDYGLRNPWRMSFDACTGDLYIGDVGQNTWEEIDVEPAGQGQRNYGWRVMEANMCFDSALNCNQPGLIPPVDTYDHNQGCSVAGGYVYRGSAIPALRGTYFYGDYCEAKIWAFSWVNGQKSPTIELTADLGTSPTSDISSFGQDNHGEVYVLMMAGTIYRIDAE